MERIWWKMLVESKCSERKCVHYIGVRSDSESDDHENPEKNERHVCRAFPKGIPDVIAFGKNLHLKPVVGDHGIQYERAK